MQPNLLISLFNRSQQTINRRLNCEEEHYKMLFLVQNNTEYYFFLVENINMPLI